MISELINSEIAFLGKKSGQHKSEVVFARIPKRKWSAPICNGDTMHFTVGSAQADFCTGLRCAMVAPQPPNASLASANEITAGCLERMA